MPKGQPPKTTMLARYNMMVKQNNRAHQKRHRIRRKLTSLFRGEDAATDYLEGERLKQRTVTQAEYKRTKWMDKFEKSLFRRGRKQ